MLVETKLFLAFELTKAGECQIEVRHPQKGGAVTVASCVVPMDYIWAMQDRIASFLSLVDAGILVPVDDEKGESNGNQVTE